MAIESAIEAGLNMNGVVPEEIVVEEISADIVAPDMVISETDDGGIMIDLDPSDVVEEEVSFDSNLADYCDDRVLQEISSELLGM